MLSCEVQKKTESFLMAIAQPLAIEAAPETQVPETLAIEAAPEAPKTLAIEAAPEAPEIKAIEAAPETLETEVAPEALTIEDVTGTDTSQLEEKTPDRIEEPEDSDYDMMDNAIYSAMERGFYPDADEKNFNVMMSSAIAVICWVICYFVVGIVNFFFMEGISTPEEYLWEYGRCVDKHNDRACQIFWNILSMMISLAVPITVAFVMSGVFGLPMICLETSIIAGVGGVLALLAAVTYRPLISTICYYSKCCIK